MTVRLFGVCVLALIGALRRQCFVAGFCFVKATDAAAATIRHCYDLHRSPEWRHFLVRTVPVHLSPLTGAKVGARRASTSVRSYLQKTEDRRDHRFNVNR